jgi:hypothetical protein
VPDGTYYVHISTTKSVGGTVLRGDVNRYVRVDTVAPLMSSVTGLNARVYPYPDGYHDTFAPAVTLSEAGSLNLTIRTWSGTLVRSLTGARAAGRASIVWNGRNASNVIVPAGTYRWTFTVRDAAGNGRTTAFYVVYVSALRLVTKTAVNTVRGSGFYSAGGSPYYCADASSVASDFYPYGVWLQNLCDPILDGAGVAAAFYRFAVPVAYQYRTIRVDTYGNTISPPSAVRAAILNTSDGGYDLTLGVDVSSRSNVWYYLGTVSALSHVSSTHVVDAAVVVTDEDGAPSDFDVGYARITVVYTAFQ